VEKNERKGDSGFINTVLKYGLSKEAQNSKIS